MIGVIDVPYWWHASILEVLWLVGGLVAAALTAGNLHDAWKDNAVLDTIRSDPAVHRKHYEMIAISSHGRLQSQSFRLVVSTLIVFAGIVGVLTVNPLRGTTTLTGLAVSTALVGISVLTATVALLDLVRRNRLYELAMGRSDVLAAQMLAKNVGKRPTKGAFMHATKHVFFNDGTDEDVFALVKRELENGNLNLEVCPDQGAPYPVNDVPQREKADYGAEGGGDTWHR